MQNQPIFYIIAPFLIEIGDKTFTKFSNLILIFAPMLQQVGKSAFQQCFMLRRVIGDNISIVQQNAFDDCYSLRDFSFENVTQLEPSCFMNCGFKSIKLQNVNDFDVTQCFDSQFQLENLDLPDSTTLNGDHIYSCDNLAVIKLPAVKELKLGDEFASVKVTSDSSEAAKLNRKISDFVQTDVKIDEQRVKDLKLNICGEFGRILYSRNFDANFNHKKLKSVFLLNTTNIPVQAFHQHYLLNSAFCPNCAEVSREAFSECLNLVRFRSRKLAVIKEKAFYYCNCLAQIDCSQLKLISPQSFSYCNSLVNLELPLIEELHNSFEGCTGLLQIIAPNLGQDYYGNFYVVTLSNKNARKRFQEILIDEFQERKRLKAILGLQKQKCAVQRQQIKNLKTVE
uniref:Leucine rich repeats-containing protein n=1 Tax=Trepomonas sp. PC1 TaxID=1076344 RepID=A0A146K4U2_9EUKA|eukprot:JAP90885.1 Leucine rich repeats-containing protein [Trepomonas sp. PC1]